MDSLQGKKSTDNYDYLLQKFTKEKIVSRYEWLYGLMEEFIKAKGLEDDILISSDVLNHVIIDYFVDVDRLKGFQNIERTHMSKIYAYLSFWLLRRKPLQLRRVDNAEHLSFINEEFVCELVRSYLFSEPENVPIMNNQRENVDNFVATLLYYFKYRDYSAKSIEIMILAFLAGRGYQYSVDHQ